MDQSGPVTVVIRHRVRPGKEAEFEDWLRGITQAASPFHGYLGFNVVRPASPEQPEYVIFFRFDTFANLEQWEESETRRDWLGRLDPLTVRPPTRERHTGLEVWFTPPSGHAQPARWKMAVVTFLAVYPLISLVQLVVVPLLEDLPLPVRTLATSALFVGLMTYLVMPLMTRLFSGWLYGPTSA
jgi:hypothetical protein